MTVAFLRIPFRISSKFVLNWYLFTLGIKDEMWSQRLCPLCVSRQFSVNCSNTIPNEEILTNKQVSVSVTLKIFCNIRNDSVMFDTFDVQLINDPHPKKDENNKAMKSTCMSRLDLISNVNT